MRQTNSHEGLGILGSGRWHPLFESMDWGGEPPLAAGRGEAPHGGVEFASVARTGGPQAPAN